MFDEGKGVICPVVHWLCASGPGVWRLTTPNQTPLQPASQRSIDTGSVVPRKVVIFAKVHAIGHEARGEPKSQFLLSVVAKPGVHQREAGWGPRHEGKCRRGGPFEIIDDGAQTLNIWP